MANWIKEHKGASIGIGVLIVGILYLIFSKNYLYFLSKKSLVDTLTQLPGYNNQSIVGKNILLEKSKSELISLIKEGKKISETNSNSDVNPISNVYPVGNPPWKDGKRYDYAYTSNNDMVQAREDEKVGEAVLYNPDGSFYKKVNDDQNIGKLIGGIGDWRIVLTPDGEKYIFHKNFEWDYEKERKDSTIWH